MFENPLGLLLSALGYALRTFLSVLWDLLLLRWLWGDLFDAPLADQRRRAAAWRGLRIAAVVAAWAGVGFLLWHLVVR